MRHLFLAGILASSMQAAAMVECAGFATDGSFVTLLVHTWGPKGVAGAGGVKIKTKDNEFGYRFEGKEISQFFEHDAGETGKSVVGLNAYVHGENPISLRYVGPNFVDFDLQTIVKNPPMELPTDGRMIVWKGPKYAATEQYNVPKFACSVWKNL